MSNKDSNLSFQKLYKIGWQNKLNHQNQSCIYQNPSKKKKKKKKKLWIETEKLIFKFPLPDILSNVASVERPDKQAINEKKACLQICQL